MGIVEVDQGDQPVVPEQHILAMRIVMDDAPRQLRLVRREALLEVRERPPRSLCCYASLFADVFYRDEEDENDQLDQ